MCTSALTLTGLTVVYLANLSFGSCFHHFPLLSPDPSSSPSKGQQFILYLLFQFGSIQSVSLLTLIIRRATFNKRFSEPAVYFPSLSDRKTRTQDLEAAEEVLNDPELDRGNDNSREERTQTEKKDDTGKNGRDKGQSYNRTAPSDSSKGNPTNAAGRGGFSTGSNQLRKRFRSNADVELSSVSHYTSSHPPHRTDRPKTATNDETHPQAEKRKKELEPRFGRNSTVRGIISKEQHTMLARLEVRGRVY